MKPAIRKEVLLFTRENAQAKANPQNIKTEKHALQMQWYSSHTSLRIHQSQTLIGGCPVKPH
jgi:hypothetical protein